MAKKQWRTALTYLGPCHRVVVDELVLERGVEIVVDNDVADRCLVKPTGRRTKYTHRWNFRRVPVEPEPDGSPAESPPQEPESDTMSIQEASALDSGVSEPEEE
jgi:hypothetical protein